MQIVHNKHLAEFYLIEDNKKRTIERVNGQWRCSCNELNCEHIQHVINFLKGKK